jgi:hypothetical protein
VGEIEMTMAFERKPDASRGPSAPSATSAESQALITEQQVLLSTAAAAALTPAKSRPFGDAIRVVAAAVGGWLASAAKPPARPVYQKRHVWLEHALMSREMDRL